MTDRIPTLGPRHTVATILENQPVFRAASWIARPAALLSFTLALSACVGTAGAVAPSAPPSKSPMPVDPDRPVFSVTWDGGFVAPGTILGRLPVIVVYPDGRVIVQGPQIAIYPGPLMPNLQERTLTPDALARLIELARDRDLLCTIHYDLPGIADATDTILTINLDGATYRVSAYALAEAQYTAAEELTADPGLVAFNKGATGFRRGDWIAAEAHFTRCLDDRACPADRRAKALYNRGVCLVRRGGLTELRAAIVSFEWCLASPAADAALTADARHNLEIAKLLWNEARARASKKPTPNDPPENPPDPPQPDPKPPDQGTGNEQPGQDTNPQSPTDIDQQTGLPRQGANAKKTERKTPGKGTLPVNVGGAELPPRTPDEVREFLKKEAVRLAKDRRSVAELVAPPERPNVKDW